MRTCASAPHLGAALAQFSTPDDIVEEASEDETSSQSSSSSHASSASPEKETHLSYAATTPRCPDEVEEDPTNMERLQMLESDDEEEEAEPLPPDSSSWDWP